MKHLKNLAHGIYHLHRDNNGAGGGGSGEASNFTPEQLKELNEMQNKSLSAHHTRMTKIFDQRFEQVQTAMNTGFESLQASLASAATPPADPPADPGKNGKADKMDPATAKRMEEYEARMSKLEHDKAEADKALAEEREAARRNEERQAVVAALRSNKVSDGLVDAAQLVLANAGVVTRNSDGDIVFRAQREGYHDDLALADGVKEWLGTDAGKHFVPPAPARGTGMASTSIPIGGSPGTRGNVTPAQRKAEGKRELVTAFLEAERTGGM